MEVDVASERRNALAAGNAVRCASLLVSQMTQPSGEQRCPECGLSCVPTASRCDCGYDFVRRESPPLQRGLQLSATVVGLLGGSAWFAVVLLLDRGWALPLNSGWGIVGAVASALVTGMAVTYVFQIPICRARGLAFIALPLVTVPTAILLFSTCVWCTRRLTGAVFSPPLLPREEFELILSTYSIYGLISLVAPVLFFLAYVNQRWARARLLGRGA
jgi:hypothetical protein